MLKQLPQLLTSEGEAQEHMAATAGILLVNGGPVISEHFKVRSEQLVDLVCLRTNRAAQAPANALA